MDQDVSMFQEGSRFLSEVPAVQKVSIVSCLYILQQGSRYGSDINISRVVHSTLCILGSVTCRFASQRERKYTACPRQICR